MSYKFIVHTEKGKPDSLRQDVEITFALTPESSTASYDPVSFNTLAFTKNSEERKETSWGSGLAWCRYRIASVNGRNARHTVGESVPILPGQSRTMLSESAAGDQAVEWGPPGPLAMQDLHQSRSVVVVNKTRSMQNIMLQTRHSTLGFYCIAAYQPLANEGHITASSNLELQVYVVTGKGGNFAYILSPEYLTKPLFDRPINCKSLPLTSSWTLSQDQHGNFQLKNDENPELGHSSPTQNPIAERPTVEQPKITTPKPSTDDMRGQLAEILKLLTDTQQRLATVEKAVTDNTAELSATKKTLADTRDQLHRMNRSGPIADHLEDLDRKYPVLEGKVDKLAESLLSARDDVSAVQKSFVVAHNHLSDVDASLNVQKKLLSDLSETRIPRLEARVDERDIRGVIEIQTRAGTVGNASRQAQSSHTEQETLRASVDRRLPALEAKTDKLMRAFGQTLENLTSVNVFLQTNQQQIHGLEIRVPAAEVMVQKLTQSAVALESRVTIVEGKTVSLSDSLAKIREQGALPSEESPALFPSRESHILPSHIGPSATATLPWLSLPQPLDAE